MGRALGPGASAGGDARLPRSAGPIHRVELNDAFWAPRIEVNRTATIPVALEPCERTNRVDLFVRAAQVLRGEEPANRNPPGYPLTTPTSTK